MDTDRFDALARQVCTGRSRRGLLRTLLGSGLAFAGAAGGELLTAEARKRRRKKKKSCKGGKKRCGKACIPSGNCCKDSDCGGGGTCDDGTCDCPDAKTLCGGSCVDLATDAANCGACGNACDTGECVHGACICVEPGDCNGCVCALGIEGDTACAGGLTADGCTLDEDCPLGSFCRDTIGGTFCSVPCPV